MEPNINPPVPEPQLKDLLDFYQRQTMLSLNCHAVGTVQQFDSGDSYSPKKAPRIAASINYSRVYTVKVTDGTYQSRFFQYPDLVDLPVIVLGGGGANVTFPIQQGDQCLIFFNDRDLDNWSAGATTGGVATARLHSLSDGIALVGLNQVGLSTYDPDRARLQYGNAYVGVGLEKIKLANELYTLNGLLQELVTEVKNLVTQTAAITVTAFNTIPVNNVLITNIGTALTSTASKIAALLE